MHAAFTQAEEAATPVHLFTKTTWEAGRAELPGPVAAYADTLGFNGEAGKTVLAPGADGSLACVLFGLGDGSDRLMTAALAAAVPAGAYKVAVAPTGFDLSAVAVGWSDGAYRFDAFVEGPPPPQLVLPEPLAVAASHEATAIDLLRDLVNAPANHMGPDAIEAAVRKLASQHKGAEASSVVGDDLLQANYPMVHAVGRAAAIPPRLIELEWGDPGAPRLAIVGKGVAFDTGGLNIKTGNYMRLMKKDMGGAAHAIALASLVMSAGLPVHLKLYVPAVENAIGSGAFRPGDVLSSRRGLSVEIDNTDAEGRLILADALTRACEDELDLVLDFATLTGAARIALGPDLAPFFTDDDALAAEIAAAAGAVGDPVWRLPLWSPYLSELKSSVADLVNGGGPMAGSITAALFMKAFVTAERWVHFDVWAWRNAKYGRPQGGAACGLRAVWAMLQKRYPA